MADYISEITEEEDAIYRKVKAAYFAEDVLSIIDQTPGTDDLSRENVGEIIRRAENTLENNASYYDAFWASINEAIESFLEERGKNV